MGDATVPRSPSSGAREALGVFIVRLAEVRWKALVGGLLERGRGRRHGRGCVLSSMATVNGAPLSPFRRVGGFGIGDDRLLALRTSSALNGGGMLPSRIALNSQYSSGTKPFSSRSTGAGPQTGRVRRRCRV